MCRRHRRIKLFLAAGADCHGCAAFQQDFVDGDVDCTYGGVAAGCWWLDGRMPLGPLDPPVRGGFRDGVGTFTADEAFRGKPIKVRFTWSRITPTSARWEQAFSPDGGKTWEVNWEMDFTRLN